MLDEQSGKKQNQELFSNAEFPGDVSEMLFQRGSRMFYPTCLVYITFVSETSFIPARVV